MTQPCTLYSLTFPNGKRYIGVTCNLVQRLMAHRTPSAAKGPYRVNQAFKKYGAKAVRCQTLVVGERNYIRELEIAAIASFDTVNNGYNISLGGDLPSPEMREKCRVAMLKRYETPEARAALSASLKGHKKSDETRARQRASWTPERRATHAAAMSRKKSPDHVAKVAASHKGRKVSSEGRAKMRAAWVERRKRFPEWPYNSTGGSRWR